MKNDSTNLTTSNQLRSERIRTKKKVNRKQSFHVPRFFLEFTEKNPGSNYSSSFKSFGA